MQTVEKNGRATIAIYASEYNGNNYLHIREHYTDKAGELKPTKKGVAINVDLSTELLAALAAAVGELQNGAATPPPVPAKAKAKAKPAKKAPAKPKATRKGKATAKQSPELQAALAAIPTPAEAKAA
jgi:hypothetical protein